MIYLGSYTIQAKQPMHLAFTKILGVGPGRARVYHYKLGAHALQRVRHTRRLQRTKWFAYFKKRFLLGNALKNLKRNNIKRLKYIKCYRGVRHSAYLPTRGQRTHSNRKTSRYLGSGTWQFVPTTPSSKVKKVSKYVRHKTALKERSNTNYNKLLQRSFTLLQKDKRYFKYLKRFNKLGHFTKLARVNQKKAAKKAKKAKK